VLQKHRVFCQLPNGDWALCTVLTTSGDESVLKVSEGKVSFRFFSKIYSYRLEARPFDPILLILRS
jgi:hypothetical protein